MAGPGESRWSSGIDAVAAELDLGAPVDWDKANARKANRFLALLLLFIGLFVIGQGSVLAWLDQVDHGEWWRSSGLLGVGLLTFVFGVVLLRRRGPDEWIVLFERGVVYQNGRKPPRALSWADVTVQRQAYQINSTPHEVTVLTGGRKSIVISELFLRQPALRATAVAAASGRRN